MSLDDDAHGKFETMTSFSSFANQDSDAGDESEDTATASDQSGNAGFASPSHHTVEFPLTHINAGARNQQFFLREEVFAQLDETLLPDSHDKTASGPSQSGNFIPKTALICGLAGVNKTETAIEYLYTCRERFDACFWLLADTQQNLALQYVEIAKSLKLPQETEITDEVTVRDAVKAWFAEPRGTRTRQSRRTSSIFNWLLVIDNADNPGIIHDWVPIEGPGSVLLTTRNPSAKEGLFVLDKFISMECLSPPEGAALLQRFANRGEEADRQAKSERISSLLGGLPMAIVQMANIIRLQHLTLEEFEEYYLDDADELRRTPTDGKYPYSMVTMWAIDQQSRGAQSLLKVLSVLDPSRIPEQILTKGAKEVKLNDYPKTKGEFFKARASLIDSSLITRNMASNEVRIHRIVQDVIRRDMDESELHAVFGASTTLLSNVWPYVSGGDPTANEAWRLPIANKFIPHVSKIEALFGNEIREDRFCGTSTSGYLFSSFGWYMSERGFTDQVITFSTLAITILKAAMKSDQSSNQSVTFWLAEAYRNLSVNESIIGDPHGLENARKLMEILVERVQRYGERRDILSLAEAYVTVGIAQMRNGSAAEAIKSWTMSIESFHSMENPPNFATTWAAINICHVKALQGDLDEAAEAIQPVLREHEEELGKDDKSTNRFGHIWRCLGKISLFRKDNTKAMEFYERSLANLEATLGEHHSYIGDVCYELGNIWELRCEATKAEDRWEQAIVVYTPLAHCRAPLARTLWKKGRSMNNRNSSASGSALLKEAMQIRKTFAPGDKRPVEELKEEDWDKYVIYWSR